MRGRGITLRVRFRVRVKGIRVRGVRVRVRVRVRFRGGRVMVNPFVKKCHEHFFKSFRIAKIGQLQNDVSFVLDKILHPEKVQKYFQT